MSNETDLDWLARNVHYWGLNTDLCFVYRGNQGQYQYEFSVTSGLTKDQWLARRAELQDKPSWKDAPEWAGWLAQDVNGAWYWHITKPTPANTFQQWTYTAKFENSGHGEVLGDWRDTLERRPESKSELEQFVSIEEGGPAKAQVDGGWFERGELPPVGVRVDVDGVGLVYGDGERNCEVLAHVEDTAVIRMSYGLGCFQSHVMSPSRTEREKAIEEMSTTLNSADFTGTVHSIISQLAETLYDAGYRKESK